MNLTRREHVVMAVMVLPLGTAVNAVFLWGVRDVIDLKDPLFWICMVAVNVALYKIGKRSGESPTRNG